MRRKQHIITAAVGLLMVSSAAMAQSSTTLEPDFVYRISTADALKPFTIIDANNDNKTWKFQSTIKCAITSSSTNSNDDWLITPGIHLKPGRVYNLSFRAKNGLSYACSFDVLVGRNNDVASMTKTLLSHVTPPKSQGPSKWPDEYTAEIEPEEEGIYYIAFHDHTPNPKHEYSGYSCVDSIAVSAGALSTSPDSVTSLALTPAAKGALSATLSFAAPSKTIGGSNLQSIDSIQIMRDGEYITTMTGIRPGQKLTYTDNNISSSAIYEYVLKPFTKGDYGRTASVSAYVGVDTPKMPANVRLHDNVSNLKADWSAFGGTGVNGGYVDPNKISVSFYKVVKQTSTAVTVGDLVTTAQAGATSTELAIDPEKSVNEDGKTQSLFFLAAQANNDTLKSDFAATSAIIVGPTLNLPFEESVSKGSLDGGFAWSNSNDQVTQRPYATSWRTVTDRSADNDGGSFFWEPYTVKSTFTTTNHELLAGDETSINLPKITLAGATNPKVIFSVYARKGEKAKMKILVQTPDGADHELQTIDLNSTEADGWTIHQLSLKDYTAERYIMLKFRGIAEADSVMLGLDDISVLDQKSNDIAITGISAEDFASQGKAAPVSVTLRNYGENAATGYSTILYAGDQPVDTITASQPLASSAEETVILHLPLTINGVSGKLNYHASVVYNDDVDNENNTSETKTIYVTSSEYATATSLKAEKDKDGAVNLSWTKPAKDASIKTTEDFERYGAFTTEMGEWSTFDGDKGLPGGLFKDIYYPHQGAAFAFLAMNPNAIDTSNIVKDNPGLAPHSGDQYAASIYSFRKSLFGTTYLDQDNWLISPRLSGKAQTVKFYALNIWDSSMSKYKEDFEVLYSTTQTDTASFVKIGNYQADGTVDFGTGANWKEFNIEIPEGAKYFAIHGNGKKQTSYMLGIDDVTYEKQALGSDETLTGYNIYRDGVKVGSVLGEALTYTDSPDDGNHTYNVTVLYTDANGQVSESAFSNDATVVSTGISTINAVEPAQKYTVYTIDGRTVLVGAKSLGSLSPGLYIVNGKKLVIK